MSQVMGAAILHKLQLLTISNSGPGLAKFGSAMAHGPNLLMYEHAMAQVLTNAVLQQVMV